MTLVDLGPAQDFPAGKLRIVTVEDRQVGILNWDGEHFAVRNVCPHLGGPLCDGSVRPLLTQESIESADLTIELDRPVLRCAWHNWEFDVRSGVAVAGQQKIKTYPVTVDDGRLMLDLGRTPVATA